MLWLHRYQAACEGFPALRPDTAGSSSFPPVPGSRARHWADGQTGTLEGSYRFHAWMARRLGLWGSRKRLSFTVTLVVRATAPQGSAARAREDPPPAGRGAPCPPSISKHSCSLSELPTGGDRCRASQGGQERGKGSFVLGRTQPPFSDFALQTARV